MKKTIIFLIILTFCLFAPSAKIYAASFDLSVSPQIFQIDLTPPAVAQAKQTITLENNSDTTLPLQITLKPFRSDGDSGDITYLKDGERIGNDPDILNKVIISQNNQGLDSITLPPKSKKSA